MISLFLLLTGGSFYEFFMTIALAIPPLTVKKGGVHLFGTVRLIRRIRYMSYMVTYFAVSAKTLNGIACTRDRQRSTARQKMQLL